MTTDPKDLTGPSDPPDRIPQRNLLSATDNVIRDGWSQEGYIAESSINGELGFTYRPFLPEDVAAIDGFIAQNQRAAPREVVKSLANEIAKRLDSWTEGEPPNYESLRRVRYPVLKRMYDIMAGYEASDEAPDADEPPKGEDPGKPINLTEMIKNS